MHKVNDKMNEVDLKIDNPVDEENKEDVKKGFFKSKTAKLGKKAFVIWIIYQTVKGTLTTTFIWAPLVYYYFFKH